MLKKTDGIALGIPLGPVLANLFVVNHKFLLFNSTTKPYMYLRYVDDTFAIFKTESGSKMFYNKLSSMHPSLKFTMEKNTDGTLPFLDVKIEKGRDKF